MKLTVWIIIFFLVVIFTVDLILRLTGHHTISATLWYWSATGFGRLIPFSIGFLACHLLLGKSGNG